MLHQTDEELIREVLADTEATNREKDLAKRLFKLKSVEDELEDFLVDQLLSGLPPKSRTTKH